MSNNVVYTQQHAIEHKLSFGEWLGWLNRVDVDMDMSTFPEHFVAVPTPEAYFCIYKLD